LVIPDSVTSIGTQAFCDCSGFLSDVWNDDNKISMDSQNVYYIRHANTYYCLGQCSNVNSSGWEGPVVLSFIEAGTKIIGNSAFHNCTNTSGSPIIPSSVISIGDSAFSYCYSLSGSLTIPNSVIFIGAYAFSSCYGFHNLNFDDFTIAPSWNKESQFSGWSNSGSVTSTGSWSQLEALQYAKDRGLPSDWQ
jgi:hypothetical protein